MPRAKLPKKAPIETFTFDSNGETVTAEVWNNRADVGTRGMHKLKLRDDVFNITLPLVDERLNSSSPMLKGKYERLLDGRLTRTEFGKVIQQIAKVNGHKIGKTLSEEIVDKIKRHYKACENALAAKESQKS